MHGLFIVLEGPDGAGTTKHSGILEARLKAEGKDVLRTFEPTDGPVGTAIREELRSAKSFSPEKLQKRFCEDRAWHLKAVIEPALQNGTIVISDRYLHSTIAYGLALGLPRDFLDGLNKKFIRPDCTILLLPSFSVLEERMARRQQTDVLEKKEFQEKVYEEYRRLAEEDPGISVVDTSGSLEEVAERISAIVQNHTA